jgi:hypothetical protein
MRMFGNGIAKSWWQLGNSRLHLLAAFVALFGVSGMANESDAATTNLQVKCSISSGAHLAPKGFEVAFCAELKKALATLPGVKLGRSSKAKVLNVELALLKANAADVRLGLSGANASSAKTEILKIVVRDSELRPSAARTLLLPIQNLIK